MERQLRDSQNHPMWEGTEIVLSFDVLRAAPTCLSILLEHLAGIGKDLLTENSVASKALGSILVEEVEFVGKIDAKNMIGSAWRFANLLADLCQFAFLCEQALWNSKNLGQYRTFVVAGIWANKYFVSRKNRWSHATSGGYHKVNNLFNDLVTGATISASDADQAVSDLLFEAQHKL